MYITVKEAAEKWNLSDRRVRVLCEEGKVEGAVHVGVIGMFPNRQESLPTEELKMLNLRLWSSVK